MSGVALIGLGAMGQRLGVNLLKAGHELSIWNRTPSRAEALLAQGAHGCVTPREAAARASTVIAVVTDDDASRQVWQDAETGILAGVRPGTVAVVCSTLTPDWSKELMGLVKSKSADYLEAPMVGSLPQIESRRLIHLVSGDEKVLERIVPLLEVSAANIQFVGEPGTAMLLKLVVNALLGIQVAALGELFGLIEAFDIDTAQAAKLLGDLPVTSPAANAVASVIVSKDYTPAFPVKLVEKDFRYALTVSQVRKAELPVTDLVRSLYATAMVKGYGQENIHAIAKLYAAGR